MKCLNSSIHHFGESGDLRNITNIYSRFAQDFCSAAGADDFYAELFQSVHELYNASFVGNAYQRSIDFAKPGLVRLGHVPFLSEQSFSLLRRLTSIARRQ